MLLPLVMPILVSRGFAAAIAGRSIKLHKALQLKRSRKKRSMAERTIPVVPTNEHAGIPNIKAYDIGIDGLPRVSKPNSCTDTDVSRTLEVERHLPAVLVTTRRLRSFAIPCDAKDSLPTSAGATEVPHLQNLAHGRHAFEIRLAELDVLGIRLLSTVFMCRSSHLRQLQWPGRSRACAWKRASLHTALPTRGP